MSKRNRLKANTNSKCSCCNIYYEEKCCKFCKSNFICLGSWGADLSCYTCKPKRDDNDNTPTIDDDNINTAAIPVDESNFTLAVERIESQQVEEEQTEMIAASDYFQPPVGDILFKFNAEIEGYLEEISETFRIHEHYVGIPPSRRGSSAELNDAISGNTRIPAKSFYSLPKKKYILLWKLSEQLLEVEACSDSLFDQLVAYVPQFIWIKGTFEERNIVLDTISLPTTDIITSYSIDNNNKIAEDNNCLTFNTSSCVTIYDDIISTTNSNNENSVVFNNNNNITSSGETSVNVIDLLVPETGNSFISLLADEGTKSVIDLINEVVPVVVDLSSSADLDGEDGDENSLDDDENITNITSINEKKVALVLGTRYVSDYKSLQITQKFPITDIIFRDSVRIEMLSEMLGEDSIVKSMNYAEGSNSEFHIEASFGRRAVRNNVELSKLKVFILYLYYYAVIYDIL
jgi:hypothetical protein